MNDQEKRLKDKEYAVLEQIATLTYIGDGGAPYNTGVHKWELDLDKLVVFLAEKLT